MRTTCDGLTDLVGLSLGESAWIGVEQARIDQFAEATDDHQWIHVQPERAAKGPFGTTIAHGYLTLALVSRFLIDLLVVTDAASVINYGLDRVRFTAVVPVGARVRGRITLLEVKPVGDAIQVKTEVTVECDVNPKPAAVAEVLTLFVPRS